MLVRFSTATQQFVGREWVQLESTRASQTQLLVPAEFSEGLAVERLVEAWLDYKAAVYAFNQRFWSSESTDREARRVAHLNHDLTVQEQRNVFELLDED